MMIQITVRNKVATCSTPVKVVCNNSDYAVHFDLDSEWDGFHVKTLRVNSQSGYQEVAFTGADVLLPPIQIPGLFAVGLYAGDIHTSMPAVMYAEKSILSGTQEHIEPQPDVYQQIISLIESGAIKGDKGDKGNTGDNGNDGFSPTVTVDDIPGGYKVTVTDSSCVHSFNISAEKELSFDAEVFSTILDFLRTIDKPGKYRFYTGGILNLYELVKASTDDGTAYYGILESYSSDESLLESYVFNGDSPETIDYNDCYTPATVGDLNRLIDAINQILESVVGGEESEPA